MSQHTRCLLFLAPLFLLPVLSPQAQVVLQNSENSVVPYPAEGNGRCVDYTANALIKEMGANISCPSPTAVISGVVVGSDGNTAEWTYDCSLDQLRFDNAIEGINYTITKRSRNITWFSYGSSKFVSDSMLRNQDPLTGTVLRMSSFALCYGLPAAAATGEPFPDCNAVGQGTNGWLGGIDCGALADGTVVTLWQPIDGDDQLFQCVCNDGGQASTVSCDPTGDSGDLPACYSKDVGQPKATTIVEFDADPITCTTSGGTRTCKCVDNPFLPGNDCE